MKLKGKVVDIQKTGEKKKDEYGIAWEKYIFTIELTGFSESGMEQFPKDLIKKRVNIVRWCAFDWHFKKGIIITLEEDETKVILANIRSI